MIQGIGAVLQSKPMMRLYEGITTAPVELQERYVDYANY
jgi:hypothetical protein